MKDILIVVKQRLDKNRSAYNAIKTEADKNKEVVQEILGAAFLIKGDNRFEITMSLYRIALKNEIPIAFFEIESCLYVPDTVC